MTSNLGSSLIRERFEHLTDQNRREIIDSTRGEVMNLLKQTIRPEFLNRIDDVIMFSPLDEKQIEQIVNLQLNAVKKMLAESGIELQATEAAVKLLAGAGYDPEFGARPVKRAIQNMVLNPLSKEIIARRVERDKPIVLDARSGQIVFNN